MANLKISKGLKRGFGSAMTLIPGRPKNGFATVKFRGVSAKPIKMLMEDDLKRTLRDLHDGVVSVVTYERKSKSPRAYRK